MGYGFIIDTDVIDKYVSYLSGLYGSVVLSDLLYVETHSRPYYSHDRDGNELAIWNSWVNGDSYRCEVSVEQFMRSNCLEYDEKFRCCFGDRVWYDSRLLDMLVRYSEALRYSSCEVEGRTITGRYIWRYPYCNLPQEVRGLLKGNHTLCVCDITGFEMSVMSDMFGFDKIDFADYGDTREQGKINFYRYVYGKGDLSYTGVSEDGKVRSRGYWYDKEVLERLHKEVGSRIVGVEDIHNKVQGRCSELFDYLLGVVGGSGRIAFHLHDEIVCDSEWSMFGVFSEAFDRLYEWCGIRLGFTYEERESYGDLLTKIF